MLSAKRTSDGQTVTAYQSKKTDGPFLCHECGDLVTLKTGKRTTGHFAHLSLTCRLAMGESEIHRYCKLEIYESLLRAPGVTNVALERPLGSNRPDVSAYIHGVPVAIEVQISSLSIETIMRRTIDYHQKGICVLWLLQWKPQLDSGRYTPRLWEKWIHAAYFGQVYYWIHGLQIVSYTFEPTLKSVPKKTWYAKNGKKMTGGGYSRRSKRHRTATRGKTFDLVADFESKDRLWWEGNGIKVPDAKLFIHQTH
jgi:competence protein CoiA